MKQEGRSTKSSVTKITVGRIVVQPSEYRPVSLDPAELEILRLKRAKVDIKVVADLAQSEFLAVLEFRGRTLVLTRKSGTANAGGVAEDLADDYAIRYEKDGLLELDEEEDAECECTIVDPDDFLDFLHLLKVRGGITYTTGAT